MRFCLNSLNTQIKTIFLFSPFVSTMYSVPLLVSPVNLSVCLARCRSSVEFSIKVAWLLGAFSSDVVQKPTWKNNQGVKLKNMILSEELRLVGVSSAGLLGTRVKIFQPHNV